MHIKALVWPDELVSQYLSTARIVGSVIFGTPAYFAKIKAGWLVLCIDDEPADNDAVILAYSSPATEIVFYDPLSRTCYHLVYACMPLGCNFLPVFNESYAQGIRSGAIDAVDYLKKWEVGDLADFANLKDVFEATLKPTSGNLLGRFTSEAKLVSLMLHSTNRWGQLGLAIAHLAIGNVNFATAFTQAYFENLKNDQGAGDPVLVTGAALFVFASVLDQLGDKKRAAILVERALERAPNALLAQDLHLKLRGEPFVPPNRRFLGQVLPMDYRLNRFDPYGIWPHLDKPLTLPRLAKGKKGLICLLGAYRSNGPYLEDLHRLMSDTLHVDFIHVISSWKGDPSSAVSQYRQHEERSLMSMGLKLDIGFDPSDEVAKALDLQSSPTWFVIAEEGIVEASGDLADASVLSALFGNP